ncbi:ketimine reductase mu-crystallin-like [Tubulanus polymorphus]|uniref:ketimine reductase mu-crystallin-like n=1 Tax=Tubulanus polymorphus TaxID=672921 RepID=UPI003DA32B0B
MTPEYISEQRVRAALNPVHTLVDALEEAFRNFSKGKEGGAIQPLRTRLEVSDHNGMLIAMPVYSVNDQALAIKVLTLYSENKRRNLPTYQGVMLLFHADTGCLASIIDAISVTEIRTAAASAVATKCIYRGEPKILAIIGAGSQGKGHWNVFSQIYSFTEVRVYSRTRSSSEKLVSHIGSRGKVCESAEDAVKNADIIITATFSKQPLVFKDWVKPGAHINALGANSPDRQELDPVLVRDSVVYVDDRRAAIAGSGDIIHSKAEIYAEIGEVIDGRKEIKRDPITIFKSLGLAIEDAVTAKLVHDSVHKERAADTDRKSNQQTGRK